MSRPDPSRRAVVGSLVLLLVVIAVIWSARALDLVTLLRRMHGL